VKYIVVYIILILGLTTLRIEAQKPTIDLLPTASEGAHHEALIDTSIARDSLIIYDSLSPLRDTIREAGTELSYSKATFSTLKKRAYGSNGGLRPVLYPLIFKKISPFNFIFFFTALKF